MNVIVLAESAAWGCSGLRADDFRALVDALVDAGHVVRVGRNLLVRNLKVLAILAGSGRPRRPGRRGAR